MELILILIIIAAVICIYFINKRPEEKPIVVEPDVFDNIIERDEIIIGFYKGLPIHKTITLDNGKVLEFYSLVVEISPNLYYSDKPNLFHSIIDDNLLYREVQPANHTNIL